MLDIEVVTPPTQTALDIVSVDDMARHMRLSPRLAANADWRARMETAIVEVVDDLDCIGGKLNRTILPRTLKRYLRGFPKRTCNGPGFISLPFPPLISVEAITIEDGSSPPNVMPSADYVVTGGLITEIHAGASGWPFMVSSARGLSVTYKAGYATFPPKLKQLIRILAAHNMENPEATINEPRQMAINRKVDFGVDYLMATLRVPVSYDDFL